MATTMEMLIGHQTIMQRIEDEIPSMYQQIKELQISLKKHPKDPSFPLPPLVRPFVTLNKVCLI